MAVRLRLALFGKKHAPVFRIVAIDSRKMRDGKYLENLGTYNPVTDEYVQFHVDRIDEWLKKGAIPSDSVKKLYKRFKQGAATAPKIAVEELVAEATEVKAEEPVKKAKKAKVETAAVAEEAVEPKAEKASKTAEKEEKEAK